MKVFFPACTLQSDDEYTKPCHKCVHYIRQKELSTSIFAGKFCETTKTYNIAEF